MIKNKTAFLISVFLAIGFTAHAIDQASQSYAPYILKKNPAAPSDKEGQQRWETYQLCVKKASEIEDLIKCKTEIVLKKHGLTD